MPGLKPLHDLFLWNGLLPGFYPGPATVEFGDSLRIDSYGFGIPIQKLAHEIRYR